MSVQTSSSLYIPLVINAYTNESENRIGQSQRMSKIGWRLTEKQQQAGGKERSKVCVSVPKLGITICDWPALLPVLQAGLETIQDKFIDNYIKSLVADDTAINLIGLTIPAALTTPEGIAVKFADEDLDTGRLSAKAIKDWFDVELAPALVAKMVEKNPAIDEATAKSACERYKTACANLAAVKAYMPKDQAETLKRAVELAGNSGVKTQLLKVLDRIINPPTMADLDDLI